MSNMKLILIEDDLQDVNLCQNALEDFNDDHGCCIELEICHNIEDGLKALEKSYFDGAIIDMRLAAVGNEGNKALDVIREHLKRIPVVICTGTPDAVSLSDDIPLIEVFKKGDVTYTEIIQIFWDIYITGLTRIMGGIGQIEKSLSKIFIKYLLPEVFPSSTQPEKSNWVDYAQRNPDDTEKALLRHTLNHIIHELYKSSENCYPEEMFIHLRTPISINTGCILKHKKSDTFYIVMSPACDLAERKSGRCNTDRALLVEIQTLDDILSNNEKYQKASTKEQKESIKKSLFSPIKNNNGGLYYHWIPLTYSCKDGAVINFRRLSTYTKKELGDEFCDPLIQVTSSFLKNIVSRFSSYYARQGQPDINFMI